MAPSPGCPLDNYAIEMQALEDYRSFSATTIQRYYRGWIVRHRQVQQRDSQLQQQQAAKAATATQQRLYKSARSIQDAWRSYNNKRIYRFYRDLIKFREAAVPRQMLKSINAREAGLIDPAAGLHVRFRLGGSSFPPLVFYKIYTHRPVTDIGAFGPRNYAADDATVHSPAVLHNKQGSNTVKQPQGQYEEYELPAKFREYIKPDGTVGYRSTKGWYRRIDNNGWRPVAERLLLDRQHQAALPPAPGSSNGAGILIRRRQRRRRARQVQGQQTEGEASEAGSSRSEDRQAGSSQSEDDCEASGSGSRSSPVYHYSPVVRREERARKLKQRRRQWLLKMYRTGMQNAAAGTDTAPTSSSTVDVDSDIVAPQASSNAQQSQAGAAAATSRISRVSKSDEQLLQLLEKQLLDNSDTIGNGVAKAANGTAAAGHGAGNAASDADWDIDELVSLGLDAGILAWTQKLDFDTYQQHWNNTAVTLGSEAAVPVSEMQLLQLLQQQQQQKKTGIS